MYAKSGRAPEFSGLHSSAHEVSEPERHLQKVIDLQTLDMDIEGGPANQDELREAMNIAYKASIERARVIDQLGGKLPLKRLGKIAEPPKNKLVSENKVQKQVGSKRKVVNKSSAKEKNNKKESGPTRW